MIMLIIAALIICAAQSTPEGRASARAALRGHGRVLWPVAAVLWLVLLWDFIPWPR